MVDGLYVLSYPSGYYPYVFIGWFRLKGTELEMHNGRVIRRFGNSVSLATLAEKGPQQGTILLEPSDIEDLWRPGARGIRANPKVWEKDCPKPEGWDDQS